MVKTLIDWAKTKEIRGTLVKIEDKPEEETEEDKEEDVDDETGATINDRGNLNSLSSITLQEKWLIYGDWIEM